MPDTQREIQRGAASPATPQSATPSTPNYLDEARQRFYATMAERERLIGERKALADSLMQIQQQRTDKALAIANLGTEVGIENIVREREFQEGKKARLQELGNMYAQHAAKYGMALNRQAIEILKEFSNINAPTLTSIMTGYEMARTSAMENDAKRLENFTKLNESYNAIQKELLASNQREAELRQQLVINERNAELSMLDYKIKDAEGRLTQIAADNKELSDAWYKVFQVEAGYDAAIQKGKEGEKPSISMRDLSPTEGEGTGKSALTPREIAIKLGDADSRISGSALVLPEEFTSAYEQNLATYVEGTGSSLEKVLKDPNALKKVYNFTFDDFLKNRKIVPVEGSDNKFFKFNVGGEESRNEDGRNTARITTEADRKKGDVKFSDIEREIFNAKGLGFGDTLGSATMQKLQGDGVKSEFTPGTVSISRDDQGRLSLTYDNVVNLHELGTGEDTEPKREKRTFIIPAHQESEFLAGKLPKSASRELKNIHDSLVRGEQFERNETSKTLNRVLETYGGSSDPNSKVQGWLGNRVNVYRDLGIPLNENGNQSVPTRQTSPTAFYNQPQGENIDEFEAISVA